MSAVTEQNPTARALRCLEILQDHPGVGAQELADRLGVSERAARRYVAVLREAGVQVESSRGRYGGYRLSRGQRRTPLMFSAEEALSLLLAVLAGHHAAADDEEPVGRALARLLRSLPGPVAEQAVSIRRTAALAPDRNAARPEPAVVTEVSEAIAARRRLMFDYRSEAGNAWTVRADPWAVVVWRGRWYLLCAELRDSGTRQRCFRIDRMARPRLLDEPAEIPADLDPVQQLEDSLSIGWEYPVSVLVEAPVSSVQRWLSRSLGRLEEVDEDRTRLTASTSNPWFYAEQLARLPASYRIESPDELREAAAAIGRRLLAASGHEADVPASRQP